VTLRKHQRETVEVCREILAGKPISEVILSVTPGGGKSFVPVILAENLIPAIAEKICWVVPRNSLKYQGEAEFLSPYWGTARRARAAENGTDLSRGCDGYLTTYQAVGADPECHAAEFRRHRYILFLDEFHHVAEGSEWHLALRALVCNAVLVVKASGTLSRGDGGRIAFLEYGGTGPVLTDTTLRRVIAYSRSEAVRDGAILRMEFKTVDGEAEWEEQDGHRDTSLLSGEEPAKALFTALRTGFATELIDTALFDFEQQITAGDYPEARMLVVAPDIEIAHVYKNHLERLGHTGNRLWGDRVQIATSDDTPAARRTIADFKRGVCRILVTVAMAYEGLNVPEISVICCLSHIRSVPWLEQCFARGNRPAPGKRRSVVYAPADHHFRRAVRMIQAEQAVPLANPDNQLELPGGEPGEEREGGGEGRPWIIPVGSAAHVEGKPEEPPGKAPPPCPPSEAEGILRKNIHGIITAYLDAQRPGSKQAHSRIFYRRMKLVIDKPIADMNQGELEKVWMWARKEYGGGYGTSTDGIPGA
jgi:superfamily II DNA or RNA helicase